MEGYSRFPHRNRVLAGQRGPYRRVSDRGSRLHSPVATSKARLSYAVPVLAWQHAACSRRPGRFHIALPAQPRPLMPTLELFQNLVH